MILYADDHMLVADKPAGLLSVPGRGEANQDCLIRRVQADYPDALIVHRLDMATSGLLVLARGPEAHRALSRAFADRQVAKTYVAVVAGEVAADEGEIDLPLITDWPNRPRQMVDHTTGKPSLTRYRVLARGEGTSRVELQPVTGRSHQLRVHMLSLGHPILGDVFYASPDIAAASPRLLLHAERLEIPHPETGETMRFHAPAPF
ncbi:MAG TPA: RluA family pseudouridine synthase [Asticcacaulis sp.]|nr:RluA family pseudouridine synthase [Asticcacaulis sp.]